MVLPLTDSGETLSFWMYADTSNFVNMKTDYNENEFFQEMERRTGVHIDFQMVAAADRQTNFNLMIASNQLTDLMYAGASYYSQGLDAAIDDGYFLDLTDKVDEYMPHYQASAFLTPTTKSLPRRTPAAWAPSMSCASPNRGLGWGWRCAKTGWTILKPKSPKPLTSGTTC